MAIRVTIENVRVLHEGLWEAELGDTDLQILGSSSDSYGESSVLVVHDPLLEFDRESQLMTFDPTKASLVNVGSTGRVVIVSNYGGGHKPGVWSDEVAGLENLISRDDHRFVRALEALPAEVRDLGRRLLTQIRTEFGGGLEYHPKSRKYVERPDNFWTIKIQPRDESLRITVRGRADSFGAVHGIDVKPDMAGYSGFKIWREDQLPGALSVIKTAKQQ